MAAKKEREQSKKKTGTETSSKKPGVKYFPEVEVICACGSKFTVGSTEPGPIRVSLCSNCHPFYTGEQKIVDTDDLVSKYKQKQEKADKKAKSRKARREEKRTSRSKISPQKTEKDSLTLKDVMKALQKGK